MKFSDLGLSEAVLRAVADVGYESPTPVQEQAIPYVLMGRDILACAQTGTGKTASFTLPMIEILAAGRAKARMPRSVILEPTRELAAQVADNFELYGKYHKLSMALLIGGVSMGDQIKVIDRGPDVLIATPGRMLDLFERGHLLLNDVKILVIDEADRMLDMGFIPDVERIVSLMPKIRQTLFLSATLPPEIQRLTKAFLINPKKIEATPPSTVAETVKQGLVTVDSGSRDRSSATPFLKQKRAALRTLLDREQVTNALVFCNRKRDVGVVARSLQRHGYNADMLHGDMSQPARMETLERLRNGQVTYLVCSDVAARGLDVRDISHVFNFDVPSHAEDYIHRIGRTGRAGRSGIAYTIASPDDRKYLAAIVKLLGKPIPPVTLDGLETAANADEDEADAPKGRSRGRKGRGRDRSERTDDRKDAEVETAATGESETAATGESETAAPKPRESKERKSKDRDAREKTRGGRDRRRKDPEERDEPVVGMGDHMPAFLMRPPMPVKSATRAPRTKSTKGTKRKVKGD